MVDVFLVRSSSEGYIRAYGCGRTYKRERCKLFAGLFLVMVHMHYLLQLSYNYKSKLLLLRSLDFVYNIVKFIYDLEGSSVSLRYRYCFCVIMWYSNHILIVYLTVSEISSIYETTS